jgi:hypothetical protein
VPLDRNRARPSCTVRARPTATRGTTRVHGAGAARVRGPRPQPAQRAWRWRPSSAGPRNVRRTTRARGGSTAQRHAARRQRCSASQRWHGANTRETAGNDGSPARRRRRGVTAMGERRAVRDGGGPGVGGFRPRRSGRRRERGGRAWRAAVGRWAARARRLSGASGASEVAVGMRGALSRQRL